MATMPDDPSDDNGRSSESDPTSSRWRTAIEERPAPDAPFREIAQHIDADVIPELWGSHERPPTRKELRRWCEANGYEHRWNRVTGELRRSRALAGAGPSGLEVDEGVAVDAEALDQIGDLAPLCPFIRRGVSLRDFGLERWEKPCGSWWCFDCGPLKARILRRHVEDRLGPLETVYAALAPWTPQLMNTMGRRRKPEQQWVWYRRSDDTVFFLSNAPIRGPKEPRSCQSMTPVDAMEFYMTEVAWVPGHVDHGWSPGWKPLPQTDGGDRRGTGPLDDGAPSWLMLDGLGDRQARELMAKFDAEANDRFGVVIETGFIPGAAGRPGQVAQRSRDRGTTAGRRRVSPAHARKPRPPRQRGPLRRPRPAWR